VNYGLPQCASCCQKIPSYLGTPAFYKFLVMPEAPLSIIARASGRQYPVFQSLYRGFPHPHIRAGHESKRMQRHFSFSFIYIFLFFLFNIFIFKSLCSSWKDQQFILLYFVVFISISSNVSFQLWSQAFGLTCASRRGTCHIRRTKV
jgi:hypothetical protein